MSVGKPNLDRYRAVFWVVVAAVGMSNLDLFIVNVALPSIGADLGSRAVGDLSWVLNAYAIAFAALLIMAGRLGDRTGQRCVFLLGAAGFTAASLACAAAPTLRLLVLARAVQAAGAAALIPTSLALLLAASPAHRRAAAVRAWAAVGGLSAALGPAVGGLLVQLDWRWVFLVNLPIGLATVLFGLRVLPRPSARTGEPRPDPWGAALLAAGVAGLTGALVQAPARGWTAPSTLGLFALAGAGLALFVVRSRVARHPLIEFRLLATPTFGAAVVASFLFSVGFAGLLLSNVLWLQEVWHFSPARTGVAIAPGPAMVPLVALSTGPLIRRLGAGPVAAAGNVVFAAGLALRILTVHGRPDYWSQFLPSLVLTGVGVGLALPTLLSAATTALPATRVATGSAIVNTGRQIAAALGIAVLVTALGTPVGAAAVVSSFTRVWFLSASIMLTAGVASLALRRPPVSVVATVETAPQSLVEAA